MMTDFMAPEEKRPSTPRKVLPVAAGLPLMVVVDGLLNIPPSGDAYARLCRPLASGPAWVSVIPRLGWPRREGYSVVIPTATRTLSIHCLPTISSSFFQQVRALSLAAASSSG